MFKEQSSRTTSARYTKAIIINVTSMAGLLGSPNMSAYTCSKHAAESFSTCLRYELKDFNIAVLTVNPSFHATPMVAGISSAMSRIYGSLAKDRPALFTEYGIDYIDETRKLSIRASQAGEWSAKNVTRILARGVFNSQGGQEMVGLDAKFGGALMRHMPVWLSDIVIALAYERNFKPKSMM